MGEPAMGELAMGELAMGAGLSTGLP